MKVYLVLGTGLLLLVGGLVMLTTHTHQEGGWFAYAPAYQSGTVDFGNGARLLSRSAQVGLALASIGLAVISGGVGFLLGRLRAGGRQARQAA